MVQHGPFKGLYFAQHTCLRSPRNTLEATPGPAVLSIATCVGVGGGNGVLPSQKRQERIQGPRVCSPSRTHTKRGARQNPSTKASLFFCWRPTTATSLARLRGFSRVAGGQSSPLESPDFCSETLPRKQRPPPGTSRLLCAGGAGALPLGRLQAGLNFGPAPAPTCDRAKMASPMAGLAGCALRDLALLRAALLRRKRSAVSAPAEFNASLRPGRRRPGACVSCGRNGAVWRARLPCREWLAASCPFSASWALGCQHPDRLARGDGASRFLSAAFTGVFWSAHLMQRWDFARPVFA